MGGSWTLAVSLVILCCGWLLAACGGGSVSLDEPATDQLTAQADGGLIEAGRTTSGFTLGILPDSFLGGDPTGDFTVEETRDGDETVITVSVSGAADLRACYGRLGYDATRYTPVAVDQLPLVAEDSGEILTLSDTATAGTVDFGQVLANCDERTGLTGDAVVAELRFSDGAYAAETRAVSSVLDTEAVAVTIDPYVGEGRITWRYYLPGDYDQNGEVGVSDLTPIAQYFERRGTKITLYDDDNNLLPPKYEFNADSTLAIIDGSNDGIINFADSVLIGRNFGTRIDEYHLYGSPAGLADYPSSNEQPDSEPLASIAFSEHIPPVNYGVWPYFRAGFSCQYSGFQEDWAYWVRPVMDGHAGTPSNWVLMDNSVLDDMPVSILEKSDYRGGSFDVERISYTTEEKRYFDIWVTDADSVHIFAIKTAFDPELYDPGENQRTSPPDTYPYTFNSVHFYYRGEFYLTAWYRDTITDHGFSGDYHICRYVFDNTPMTANYQAYTGRYSKDARARFNPATQSIEWLHCLNGDLDQDGHSANDDFIVLGLPWIWDSRVGGAASMTYFCDSNGDGYITINDLRGGNSIIDGYNVYASMDSADADHDEFAPVDWVPFSAAEGDQVWERLRFTCPIPSAQDEMYLWIRPTYKDEVGWVPEGGMVRIPGAEDG